MCEVVKMQMTNSFFLQVFVNTHFDFPENIDKILYQPILGHVQSAG